MVHAWVNDDPSHLSVGSVVLTCGGKKKEKEKEKSTRREKYYALLIDYTTSELDSNQHLWAIRQSQYA